MKWRPSPPLFVSNRHEIARVAGGLRLGAVVVLGLLLGLPAVRADTILLRGGERLIGKVLAEEPDKVRFESQTLGVLEIPRDRVEQIERDAPPPPVAATAAAPIAAVAEKETIVPAPPAAPVTSADVAKETIVPAPPPEPAPKAAPTVAGKESIAPLPPTEPAGPKVVTVTEEKSTVPAPPPAPTPVPAPAVAAEQPAKATVTPPASPPSPAVVVTAPTAPAPVTPPTVPVVVPEAAPVITPVAQVEPAQPPPTPPAAVPAVTTVFYPWSGLRTEQDTYDWIQLKSGEWLKGKIKGMQNYELEFDSDKLDLLTFDWKDVTIVRSPRLNSVWFGREGGTAAGSVLVTGNEVKVISAAGTTTFSRDDLLAITPTGKLERNNWTGKLMFGLNLRSGNNVEKSYSANASVQRRTPLTRLKLDYLGNYSYTNGVTNEENIRSTAVFDYFFSRKLYVRFPDLEYYRDPLQNIDGRVTAGGAAGYEFYRTPNFELDATAGPAYTSTQYLSVEAGKDQTETTVAAILSAHMDWLIRQSPKIDWIVDYRAQLSGKESAGGTSQHTVSTLEFEIHKRLKLDLTFTWDRVGNPKPDENGVVPLPNDYRLTTSLGVDF